MGHSYVEIPKLEQFDDVSKLFITSKHSDIDIDFSSAMFDDGSNTVNEHLNKRHIILDIKTKLNKIHNIIVAGLEEIVDFLANEEGGEGFTYQFDEKKLQREHNLMFC